MRSLHRRLIGIAAVLAVAVVPIAASAAPTCTPPLPQAACGGRVVPPPLQSATFLQYGSELVPALEAIEALAPDIIEVDRIGDLIGQPELRSRGGLDVWVVRITDEALTTPKRQVAISLSIHGQESAGREGGIRYLEDLARWWVGDREHALYAGDTPVALDDVLAETEIYLAFLNPDGWAAGDLGSPGTFARGNADGVDLNRQFPTIGWTGRNQLAEPEAAAWHALVQGLPDLATATDIHGELTSPTESFSDIMYPAGQWDPREIAQELQLARNMARTVERKFAEEGVVVQTLFDAAGEDRPMQPASFATAYDIVGYDDSGFMGDWLVAEGAVEVDVENFLSHTVPANVWFGPLEQAHVAAVKGNIEAVIAESMLTRDVEADLDLGRVAYVLDPAPRFTRPASDDEAAYDASRMDYFEELEAVAGVAVDPFAPEALASADLASYDSLVVADAIALPDAAVAALGAFASAGGQLVLTDAALQLLPVLSPFTAGDVERLDANGGFVDFGDLGHPWESELEGVVGQTYFAVPLGYRSDGDAPNWGVASQAWDAAPGATTVGTIDGGALVNLGHFDHGNGEIAVFGSILPTQTTQHRIDHGLADYAISVSGAQVLQGILAYRR